MNITTARKPRTNGQETQPSPNPHTGASASSRSLPSAARGDLHNRWPESLRGEREELAFDSFVKTALSAAKRAATRCQLTVNIQGWRSVYIQGCSRPSRARTRSRRCTEHPRRRPPVARAPVPADPAPLFAAPPAPGSYASPAAAPRGFANPGPAAAPVAYATPASPSRGLGAPAAPSYGAYPSVGYAATGNYERYVGCPCKTPSIFSEQASPHSSPDFVYNSLDAGVHDSGLRTAARKLAVQFGVDTSMPPERTAREDTPRGDGTPDPIPQAVISALALLVAACTSVHAGVVAAPAVAYAAPLVHGYAVAPVATSYATKTVHSVAPVLAAAPLKVAAPAVYAPAVKRPPLSSSDQPTRQHLTTPGTSTTKPPLKSGDDKWFNLPRKAEE
ncbi:hypothetical protein MRX96_002777 [Rhipicephalus microplus]